MPKKAEKSTRPGTFATAAIGVAAAALVVYTVYHFSQTSEVTVIGAKGPVAKEKNTDSRPVAASGKTSSASTQTSRTKQETKQEAAELATDRQAAKLAESMKLAARTEASLAGKKAADTKAVSSSEAEARYNDKKQPAGRRISTLTSGASIATRAKEAEEVRKKAREFFDAGKYSAAVAAYQEATELEPGNASSFAGLGASFLASKDTDGAIVAYQRAIQLSPNVSEYYAGLGRAHFTKGDKDRAINAYKKAQEIDPDNSDVQMALQRLGQ